MFSVARLKLGIRRLASVVKSRSKYKMSTETENHLHNLVKKGFTDGGNYDKHRPEYTPHTVDEVVSMLLENYLTTQGGECDIIELGAGTGKLTQSLFERLPKDLKFIASEPMPDFIATLKTQCPDVDARQFSAESIPLPDNSVQGIVAAQCFHWFANQKAADEITRVLKPGGNLVLLWNVRDIRVGWMNAIVSRMYKHLIPGEPQYSLMEWKMFMDNYEGLNLTSRKYLDYPSVKHTKDGIMDYFSTISVISRMSEEERQKTFSDMKRILDTDPETKDKDTIPFPMYTDVCHYVKS